MAQVLGTKTIGDLVEVMYDNGEVVTIPAADVKGKDWVEIGKKAFVDGTKIGDVDLNTVNDKEPKITKLAVPVLMNKKK